MIRIHSGLDTAKLRRLQRMFAILGSDTEKITGQASRRVAMKVRDFIGDYTTQEYNIPKNDITKFIRIFRGGVGQEATLHLRGSKLSLNRFHTTASRTSTLRAGVIRGNATAIPRAFYKVGKSNNLHVFAVKKDAIGTPKERDKSGLTVLRGPSIPQMAGTARAINKIDTFIRAEIDKELNPGLDRILRGSE